MSFISQAYKVLSFIFSYFDSIRATFNFEYRKSSLILYPRARTCYFVSDEKVSRLHFFAVISLGATNFSECAGTLPMYSMCTLNRFIIASVLSSESLT